MAENSQKRKAVSTKEEPNGEPTSKAMRPDDGGALSPSSIAAMAYNAVRAVRTYAVRTFNAYAVRTDIPQLRQEEARIGIPTTSSAAVGHAESRGMHADVAEQSAHSSSVVRKQIEPGPNTSASVALQHDGGGYACEVKLKKVAKVELQRGYTSWYTEISPASLKVTEESGETREIVHFAELDGCLVDEMVFECRDKTTDKLVRQLYKDKSIGVHVKRLVVRKLGGGTNWVHFESGIKRLQDLAEGLRSLQLIVWQGMTEKHLFKLPCFVSRKLVFEYPDDLDDVEMTRENFIEILRRSGEPPVKVEKYFTLPAPLHINIDSFGGDLYERMMLSLVESLHKIHKNDSNVVTLVRAVRPWYSKRGFWVSFATSLFKFVKVTANPASRLPEYAERCAWIHDPMSDVKDITFRLELDYRDGARDEFEKFAKSPAVDVKPSDGDSLEFTAKYGSYEIRCAFTLEPSITVNVDGHDEVQENSLVSISIVKRV
ncbi:hypothetical protein AAVH_11298 [Aphelenchoides avenae]|nr:hypothetical protein AAVH_11298 [Aphelenchus avenae]